MARATRIPFAPMGSPFRKDWRVHWTAAEAGSRLRVPSTCPQLDGQHGLGWVDDGKVACETGAHGKYVFHDQER